MVGAFCFLLTSYDLEYRMCNPDNGFPTKYRRYPDSSRIFEGRHFLAVVRIYMLSAGQRHQRRRIPFARAVWRAEAALILDTHQSPGYTNRSRETPCSLG